MSFLHQIMKSVFRNAHESLILSKETRQSTLGLKLDSVVRAGVLTTVIVIINSSADYFAN